jgi:hypothetical protein
MDCLRDYCPFSSLQIVLSFKCPGSRKIKKTFRLFISDSTNGRSFILCKAETTQQKGDKEMTKHKLTFNQILAGLEKDNSERLMKKARTANSLAKKSRGAQRQTAYAVKTGALGSLVRKMPARVDIRKDIILTDFVVVELKNTNVGLHFPVAGL